MPALYKGVIVSGVIAAIAVLSDHRRADGRAGHAALSVRADRPGADGRDGRHHRVLHGHQLQPREEGRGLVDDRPCDEHHRGPRRVDEVDGAARARCLRCDLGRVRARRALRHRDRGHEHAVDDGHDRRARRVRPDHRQRRRHRRDVEAAEGSPARHRRARRRRQHDEGRHEGLRDRLGGSRGARAVRRLHAHAARKSWRATLAFDLVGSPRDHRSLHRRSDSVSSSAPWRWKPSAAPRARWSTRSAASSARSRASWKARTKPDYATARRHADQGRDQGDDRSVAAAVARAGRRRLSCSAPRRSAACSSARS